MIRVNKLEHAIDLLPGVMAHHRQRSTNYIYVGKASQPHLNILTMSIVVGHGFRSCETYCATKAGSRPVELHSALASNHLHPIVFKNGLRISFGAHMMPLRIVKWLLAILG